MTRTFLMALALILSAVLPAHAFMASNNLVVEPAGEGRFTVPYRGASGVDAFWCAAGDYVVAGLGLAPTTRIYRHSSPPRRAGQGIIFGLSSSGAKKTGLLLWSGERSITASHARQFCEIPRLMSD